MGVCVLLQDVSIETQDSGAISIHGDSFQTENNRTYKRRYLVLLVQGKEWNENLHPLKNMLYRHNWRFQLKQHW